MNYTEAVAAAAGALRRGEDANWELARLTYENTHSHGQHGGSVQTVSLDRWSADVRDRSNRKFSLGHARNFRRIWEHFVIEECLALDTLPCWTEAMEWAWPSATSEAREERAVNRWEREAPPEQKAEMAAHLLADPEVLERVMQPSNPASRALSDAVDTQRAIRRLDEALEGDEPTASRADFEQRVREVIKTDVPSQYDEAMLRLSEFTARYRPDQAAEEIARSPHTSLLAHYDTQAQALIAWLEAFRDGLQRESRPRLVAAK